MFGSLAEVLGCVTFNVELARHVERIEVLGCATSIRELHTTSEMQRYEVATISNGAACRVGRVYELGCAILKKTEAGRCRNVELPGRITSTMGWYVVSKVGR